MGNGLITAMNRGSDWVTSRTPGTQGSSDICQLLVDGNGGSDDESVGIPTFRRLTSTG